MYYDVNPSWEYLYTVDPTAAAVQDLMDATVVALRLTTLMRSADLANLIWGMWRHEDKYYVKTVDNPGELRTVSVDGWTLGLTSAYLFRHREAPRERFLRQLRDPRQAVTDQWLAKRALVCMARAGLDTRAFKAHSLRGAAATHLLKAGVPGQAVQTRGVGKPP